MSEAKRRDFDKAAAHWDEKPFRRQLASAVASGIAASLPLGTTMQALEFGCGTGLVGLQLAASVGRLTAADTSAGMLAELEKKCQEIDLENVTPLLVPPDDWTLPADRFDLVFTSMVMHHIDETEALLRHFFQILKPGGFLALADLETEDGTFHEDPTGVVHHGFDPQALVSLLAAIGFTGMQNKTVHTVRKQRENGEAAFPVFLLTAQKPQ